jgi:hypothetical protein
VSDKVLGWLWLPASTKVEVAERDWQDAELTRMLEEEIRRGRA